jgi:hypothetical protein
MMREVAELANVDRAALWHQLCASEDEIIRIRDERKAENSNMAREKANLSQKLSDCEATNNRLKVPHIIQLINIWGISYGCLLMLITLFK